MWPIDHILKALNPFFTGTPHSGWKFTPLFYQYPAERVMILNNFRRQYETHYNLHIHLTYSRIILAHTTENRF